jgi:C_GCAxxG_C_C family probable redox protein
VCQVLGLKSDSIPRIATPFGGGLGHSGLVCGAISGACMAIGLVRGRRSADDPRDPAYDGAQKLVELFVEEMKSPLCRELTGFDLRTPESVKEFRQSGVPDRVCAPAIVLAARLAVDVLKGD